MNRFLWLALLLAGAVLVPAVTRARTLAPARTARPLRAMNTDNSQYLDINRIKMWVTNTGSFAWDKGSGNAGLEFPKGSTKTAVFAAGLWMGGQVNGATRVAVSEYDDEYGPGPIIGGVAAPDDPKWRVFKLNRVYASTAVRDAALADYEANAEPYGAPDVSVQGDGTLNILGDQMT